MTNNPILRPTPHRNDARPVVSPLEPSVVFATDTPDDLDALYEGGATGFTYSREGHPNASKVAGMIDALEGATGGILTSSGMSAVSLALLSVAQSGDHVLGGNQLYGRSLRMMAEELPRLGIETSLFDPTDIQTVLDQLRPNTKAILVEVVSNPTLRVADMQALTALCRDRDIKLIVDNTFTTPRAYQPLVEGADIVLHSVTKLLAGHSDAMLGYVAAREASLAERLYVMAVTWGMTPSPWDCWLAERGLLSFDLRFERVAQNAAQLARILEAHPGVETVIYPGLESHPDHDRALSLMGQHHGNMVSFVMTGGRKVANAFAAAIRPMSFAPTLGDINTTLSHPASSSHRALTPQARESLGMTEGFFRVSVGVEPIDLLEKRFVDAIDIAVTDQ